MEFHLDNLVNCLAEAISEKTAKKLALQPIINPLIDTISDRLAQKVVDVLATSAKKEPRYYTRSETAQLLHVTLPTLARFTNDGLITAKKFGNRILYDAEAIDAAVMENRIFKYKRIK